MLAEQQLGAEVARGAHNPEVPGSKPGVARFMHELEVFGGPDGSWAKSSGRLRSTCSQSPGFDSQKAHLHSALRQLGTASWIRPPNPNDPTSRVPWPLPP